MQLRCAKTAEWIKVMFAVETLGDRRRVILDGDPTVRGREMGRGEFCPL